MSRSLYSAYSDLSKLESQPNRDHILKYFCVCWKLGVRFVLSGFEECICFVQVLIKLKLLNM